jgi:hypothetical protein
MNTTSLARSASGRLVEKLIRSAARFFSSSSFSPGS